MVADQRLVELDPGLFRVDASEASDASGSVVDRRADTFWGTAGPQEGAEWLRVDLGTTARVALVRWLPRTFQEVPRGIRLEASLDGIAWRVLVELPAYDGPLYWSAGRPMQRVRGGRVELRVPPTPARYLRITQTGRDERWGWTVREIFVYADAQGPPSADGTVEGQVLARGLRDAGVTRLYAITAGRAGQRSPILRSAFPRRISSSITMASGVRPLTSCRRSIGRRGLAPSSSRRTLRASCSLRAAPVSSSAPVARGPRAVPSRAVTPAPGPAAGGAGADGHGIPAPRAGLPGGGRRAPDPLGHQGPAAAGDWFRIDLAAPRRLHTVRFTATNPSHLPETLEIEVSADGTSWRKVPATTHVERTLRWGGIALLADSAVAVRLDMEGVTARAVRLVLSEGHPEAPWSIHELELRASD